MIEPFAVAIARDVVRAEGPDAASYLQGQVSQDVEALPVGASAWSFVLQPQGKVDAWFRVTRLGDETFSLDVDGGFGAAVVARLQRFMLRTKAELTLLDGWSAVALRGSAIAPIDLGEMGGAGGFTATADWREVMGVDILGLSPEVPAGVRTGTEAEYESLRIECGIPAMGRELTERTIPAESGVVDRSVSFTKGCFTGQELVARIDSRGGNVPRHLRGLVLDGDGLPDDGAEVLVDGDSAGVVTSAAWSDRLDAVVALAYVKRAIDVPTGGTVGGRVARIEPLPLLPFGG